jgi:Integrase core domain
MQNAFIESFNGRLRDEFLNKTLFSTLAQARIALAAWRADDHGWRPHSGLGWPTPPALASTFHPRGIWRRLRQWLRPSTRRTPSPTGRLQPPERTQDWIKLGGKVSGMIRQAGTGLFAGSARSGHCNVGRRHGGAGSRSAVSREHLLLQGAAPAASAARRAPALSAPFFSQTRRP